MAEFKRASNDFKHQLESEMMNIELEERTKKQSDDPQGAQVLPKEEPWERLMSCSLNPSAGRSRSFGDGESRSFGENDSHAETRRPRPSRQVANSRCLPPSEKPRSAPPKK